MTFTKRKSPRLQSFDYNSVAGYFITICTRDRKCLLSRVVGTGVPDCPRIELTEYGMIAEKYIKKLDAFYDHLSIESYVIMPNHIHILLFLNRNGQNADETQQNGQRTPVPTITMANSANSKQNGQSRTPVPTVKRANSAYSQFVSTFKRFCNKDFGENIWQARSYDHIIRDREDLEKHLLYIYENPMKWYFDELFSE